MRIRIYDAVVAVLLTLSSPVGAENISVDPLGWDFGEVEIGTSQSIDFTLTSLGPTPLTITEIGLIASSSSPFLLTVGISGTTILLPGQDILAQVSFSPTSLGLFESTLSVLSDATPPDNNLDLLIRGTGASASVAVPEPPILLLLTSGLIALVGLRARRRVRGSSPKI